MPWQRKQRPHWPLELSAQPLELKRRLNQLRYCGRRLLGARKPEISVGARLHVGLKGKGLTLFCELTFPK